MEHGAPRVALPPRAHRILLAGLAVLGVATAAFAMRSSPAATARSSAPAAVGESTPAPDAAAERPPLDADVPGAAAQGPARNSGPLGIADGFIREGASVSVFDDATPAVAKLDPDLRTALRRAATEAATRGVSLRVTSGWRSPAYQERLLEQAITTYGSRQAAARWVATPETSAHVSGAAVDLGPSAADRWLSTHGAAYGLCQIYRNEPWHYERRPAAVTDGCPRMYADPTQDPRMQATSVG